MKLGTLKTGDRVAYTAQWLCNTGQKTGPAGKRRGVVMSRYEHRSGMVYVRWDDTTPEQLKELHGSDPEYINHVLLHGTLVAEANLAIVGPNVYFCEAKAETPRERKRRR